ncbi:sporulation protein YtfJ [Thermoanaerobacter thermohydrosulfuricus]|uniref:Sporulation protein YtfJ n=2 Tax=Thermoanaerobacter thermohydrosulfuricus TaxID=1516 RepID=M8DUH0_THETY|nr:MULTISPECIES: GerW family sporulation protein [Thermoanaerobacter]EMT40131.1 sporulation protein YtfJ [Thermoanaerobacter thermohydrosulfuricus WC1]SDG43925.1 sporulation protein YtfJ [Thermoanaerobacter thermohydrosulfuricus]SFE22797.1 sporulation protein YtfJ [Thermoanaerobacter thermohydrosulfuricus]
MSDHPIDALMKTTMESLKDMIDVNTIVGDAVETPDGTIIIPISRVTFGFAAGGGEINLPKNDKKGTEQDSSQNMPFAGGSGAGVSVQPVAFMVVGQGQIRLLPVTQNAMLERIIDLTPKLIEEIQNLFNKGKSTKKVQNPTINNNADI